MLPYLHIGRIFLLGSLKLPSLILNIAILLNQSDYCYGYAYSNIHVRNTFAELFPLTSTYNFIDTQVLQVYKSSKVSDTSHLISSDILNNLFYPFQECFIHITNFQGINIPSVKTPFILRELKPALVVDPVYIGHDRPHSGEFFTWVSSSCNHVSTNGTNIVPVCKISKFFHAFDIHHDGYCSRLNKHEYTSASKLWRCEVHVGLFPPNFITERNEHYYVHQNGLPFFSLNELKYPRVWYFEDTYRISSDKSTESTTPANTPVFNMIITKENVQVKKLIWLLEQFSNSQTGHYARDFRKSHISFDVFLLVKLADENDKGIKIIRQCYHCLYLTEASNPVQIVKKFDLKDWIELKFKAIEVLAHSKPNKKLHWKMFHNMLYKQRRHREFDMVFDECQDQIKISTGLNKPVNTDINLRFAQVYVHLWKIVLQNYSYHLRLENICDNGNNVEDLNIPTQNTSVDSYDRFREPVISIYMDVHNNGSYLHLPVSIIDSRNSLRFVSCGKRSVHPLAFGELFNVFNQEVWYMLIFSTLFLGITFGAILKFGENKPPKYFDLIFTLFATFFSNGISFNAQFVRVRILLSGFLLCVVVLTNAYLNTNVYNLIAPVSPIAYETFKQLSNDLFTTYTRSLKVDFGTQESFATADLSNVSISSHWITYSKKNEYNWISFVVSEVDELTRRTIYNQDLHNLSKLHPEVAEIMPQVQLDVFPNKTRNDDFPMWELQRRYWDKEDNILLKSLKRCEHTAIILPHQTCIKFANELHASQKFGKGQIYIGKETYFKTTIGFQLKGILPPHVFKRIQILYSAGLWNWWNDMLSMAGMKGNERKPENPLRTPTMSGNIQVIFALLCVGLLLSVIMFVFEYFSKRFKPCSIFKKPTLVQNVSLPI